MKTETSQTPKGLTGNITREGECYLVITDGRFQNERIDIDFDEHLVRIYSDNPWPVETFKRNGTPTPKVIKTGKKRA